MRRHAALIAPVALLVACGSHAGGVPDGFSGTWKLSTTTGTQPSRVVAVRG